MGQPLYGLKNTLPPGEGRTCGYDEAVEALAFVEELDEDEVGVDGLEELASFFSLAVSFVSFVSPDLDVLEPFLA